MVMNCPFPVCIVQTGSGHVVKVIIRLKLYISPLRSGQHSYMQNKCMHMQKANTPTHTYTWAGIWGEWMDGWVGGWRRRERKEEGGGGFSGSGLHQQLHQVGIKPPGLERQEREIARKINAESPIQRDRKEMQHGERGGRGRAGKKIKAVMEGGERR